MLAQGAAYEIPVQMTNSFGAFGKLDEDGYVADDTLEKSDSNKHLYAEPDAPTNTLATTSFETDDRHDDEPLAEDKTLTFRKDEAPRLVIAPVIYVFLVINFG